MQKHSWKVGLFASLLLLYCVYQANLHPEALARQIAMVQSFLDRTVVQKLKDGLSDKELETVENVAQQAVLK